MEILKSKVVVLPDTFRGMGRRDPISDHVPGMNKSSKMEETMLKMARRRGPDARQSRSVMESNIFEADSPPLLQRITFCVKESLKSSTNVKISTA